jgi:anti-sigma B factor antagonist
MHAEGPSRPDAPGMLRVALSADISAARVRLTGELDLATVDQLLDTIERVRRRGRPDVVLDLTGLRFCDASGLRAFLSMHRQLRADGGGLTVTGARPVVRRLLSLTDLDAVLDIR